MSAGRLSRVDGGLRLEGELGFATARLLWQEAAEHLPVAGTVTVDLAGVTRADSAGVALLIHWTRIQRDHGGGVEFVNIPAQMRSIARVSGVDGILPLSDQ
ncbi:STAS domain-containing protein [Aquisalimonas sp.]|uniref:STAS domain-containing protein n=1 Tax=unclassified Aquisalimonas TaxID=2644645 RepID=UPI0025BF8A20|nr:STAS domain-containing protein [Aquisalimonas sp.]